MTLERFGILCVRATLASLVFLPLACTEDGNLDPKVIDALFGGGSSSETDTVQDVFDRGAGGQETADGSGVGRPAPVGGTVKARIVNQSAQPAVTSLEFRLEDRLVHRSSLLVWPDRPPVEIGPELADIVEISGERANGEPTPRLRFEFAVDFESGDTIEYVIQVAATGGQDDGASVDEGEGEQEPDEGEPEEPEEEPEEPEEPQEPQEPTQGGGGGDPTGCNPGGNIAIVERSEDIPPGFVGEPYSFQMHADYFCGSLTWRVLQDTPPGISLTPGGLMEGTPSECGMFEFTVGVRDSFNRGTQEMLTLIVVEDGDLRVDLLDFGDFQVCWGRSVGGESGGPDCDCFDFDKSGVIDLPDFGAFQHAARWSRQQQAD